MLDLDGALRRRHEQRQTAHRAGVKIAEAPVDRALSALRRGDVAAAREACPTRSERWDVFRLDQTLGAALWADTAEEFATTVKMFGPPERW